MTKQNEGRIGKEKDVILEQIKELEDNLGLVEQEKKMELPKGVTQEQIEQWKEKHGEKSLRLKSLYRDGSIDPYLVVTRVPSRRVTSEYIKLVDKDFEKATSILVTNCCLHNAEEIKADNELFYTAGKAIAEDLPMGRIESKNL
jgi:hypothetical protein